MCSRGLADPQQGKASFVDHGLSVHVVWWCCRRIVCYVEAVMRPRSCQTAKLRASKHSDTTQPNRVVVAGRYNGGGEGFPLHKLLGFEQN